MTPYNLLLPVDICLPGFCSCRWGELCVLGLDGVFRVQAFGWFLASALSAAPAVSCCRRLGVRSGCRAPRDRQPPPCLLCAPAGGSACLPCHSPSSTYCRRAARASSLSAARPLPLDVTVFRLRLFFAVIPVAPQEREGTGQVSSVFQLLLRNVCNLRFHLRLCHGRSACHLPCFPWLRV